MEFILFFPQYMFSSRFCEALRGSQSLAKGLRALQGFWAVLGQFCKASIPLVSRGPLYVRILGLKPRFAVTFCSLQIAMRRIFETAYTMLCVLS